MALTSSGIKLKRIKSEDSRLGRCLEDSVTAHEGGIPVEIIQHCLKLREKCF
jgi:hypothetical protein